MKPTDTPVRRDTRKMAPPVAAPVKGKKTPAASAVRKARPARAKTAKDPDVPTMTATQLKKGGWPGVMDRVNKATVVAVTNHHRTEAVILSAGYYAALVQQASQPKSRATSAVASPVSKEIALARLQSEFDRRLARLKDGASLGAAASKPARRGKVKLGTAL